ncbi:hypothetical protein [Maledivibacter halophilus]|uniref:Uncharacterized protein n=1 Tax=Maledivibacter halophilus TaxID=36842 RepID=A0A1T5IC78_9FIRM|nr:hypothetical protein [Maledivibacter halophilus]SKC36747.1 hypothetical protein SAMN02194393_00191 [Maledivibacter halophilus]
MGYSKKKYRTGSLAGFTISVGIGFLIYFILNNIHVASNWLDYNTIVANAGHNLLYKFIWYIMNFTEAQFYAGFFASLGIIVGGFIAWRLDVKNSTLRGFDISYGSNLWPWVLASQLLSLFIAIFILNYTRFFDIGDYTWLPTFITVVGIPPAIMLLYGPNIKALFTGSILGGIMGFPVAFWINNNIIPVLEVPGVVSNVFTMAITGILVCAICKALPWMERVPANSLNRPKESQEQILENMKKPSWFVRRVFADFTEAQFYANEIAGLFLIIGVCLDWILNVNHGAYASGAIPAIILSQFIGSAIGIFLYFDKYVEKGWYATFVPVVSVGPACVLMFGANVKVAVIAGALGGIIGPPLAEYFCDKLPKGYHPTIGNVTSMGVTTIVVSIIIKVLPWF